MSYAQIKFDPRSQTLLKHIDDLTFQLHGNSCGLDERDHVDIIIGTLSDHLRELVHTRQVHTLEQLREFAQRIAPHSFIVATPRPERTRADRQRSAPREISAIHDPPDDSSHSEYTVSFPGSDSDNRECAYVNKQKKPIKASQKRWYSKPVEDYKNDKNPKENDMKVGTIVYPFLAVEGDENVRCAKCLVWGHHFKKCRTQPNREICYKCTRPGVASDQCPCSKNA
ncbi:PREDICTED: uncharacterized protein LOC108362603 [Rhagoletis zephyria]|uniref:uncharacterized protein LOC108362603 n=1 Tax=Rhagoletis zephyria TaxID=28612 RepID=UPI0008116C7F|nr:PREDICTED: uncharacterized protein LOC108362603 [Rhagoletis zephyria]